jgi:hypothetical protein
MKRFMNGAAVWTFVGIVAYVALRKEPAPAPQPITTGIPTAVVLSDDPPAPPALLPDVVQLADLDPLLDPPVRAVGGTPFDPEAVFPAVAAPTPDRIPPAID